MPSRKQTTIYSSYNKQSNLLSSTARNVFSICNRLQLRSKAFRTLEGSKGITHYLGDKNRFDVSSEGPSSGISAN